MEDIEILQKIKKHEDSTNSEIEQFINEKESMLKKIKAEYDQKIQAAQQNYQAQYEEYIASVKNEIEIEKKQILEKARLQAASLNLNISDEELRELLIQLIREYLK